MQLEPCLHSQRMLRQAALILLTMGQDRPSPGLDGRRQSAPAFCKDNRDRAQAAAAMPPLVFDGPEEKKRTFELALAALNYQVVFEDILQDSDFFKFNPDLYEERELVMVVLWDYQSRKFQARRWGEEEEEEGERWEVIQHIERALQAQRTKLKACLARRRIKAAAPKIEFLLPDSIRRRSCSQKLMPICAWVNTLKTQLPEVLETLQSEGLNYLSGPPAQDGECVEFQGRSFYLDPHCRDLLIFSADCGPFLQQHALLQQAHLVCQDKSWCLAAHSVVPLSTETNDVLVVNPGPGWVVGHLSVLLQQHKGRVLVISTHEDEDHDQMIANLDTVGVSKNVKVIREPITRLRPDDARLKNVTSALIIADCSKSAISNIVQYIVLEGENMKELGKVSEPEDLDSHLTALQASHVAHLRAALTFPRMRGVVYLTRSVYPEENEGVVDTAVAQVNAAQSSSSSSSLSSSSTRQQQPWMLTAPVLPFSARDMEQRQGMRDKYVRFLPTSLTNGCFLVCLARKPEDPGSIISRAKSKGLLGKPSSSKPKKSALHRGEDGGAGGDHVDIPHGPPHRKDSLVKRSKVLRRLSSPVWPPSQKVADYKVPEHHKVIFHPTPFK